MHLILFLLLFALLLVFLLLFPLAFRHCSSLLLAFTSRQPWSEYNQDERHSIKGIWKKREGHPVSEITLTLFQHAATNRELVLAGKKDGDKRGTLFKGSVLEGIRDPVCIGKWRMRMVTRDFDLIPVSSDICPDDFYGYTI